MRLSPSDKLKVLMVLMVLATSFHVAGCGSFMKNTTASLGTIAVGVNATMEALDEMYTAGYITEETKDKIVEIHKTYRLSHRSLVTALMISSDPGLDLSSPTSPKP